MKDLKCFTGWEYLLIDAASKYGLDKLTFEERIDWATQNLSQLDDAAFIAAGDPDDSPLYQKAVMAIRKAQKGLPTGHLIGLDAVCSGMQVMSVLTGCVAGATATGLVDPDVRADAYTSVTAAMNAILQANGSQAITVSRGDAKDSTMTMLYGSVLVPQSIFGAKTAELAAFYGAVDQVAPGPAALLQDLLNSWNPYAKHHAWQLPDGYDAYVKVTKETETRIEVDELDHATFMYHYYKEEGTKKGKSNAANLVHAMDAYILRCMHRRCNYDRQLAEEASRLIQIELIQRAMGKRMPRQAIVGKFAYYVDQYFRSTLADIVIVPHLTEVNIGLLTTEHLQGLASILYGMLQYQPFPLVTVHDEFRCSPNNANFMRWQYREILAEIAESNVLDDLLTQLHNKGPGTFKRQVSYPSLGSLIRKSNYGIC